MDLGTVHHTVRLQRSAHHFPSLRAEQRGSALSIQFVGRHLKEPLLVQVSHALREPHPAQADAGSISEFLQMTALLPRRMVAESYGPGSLVKYIAVSSGFQAMQLGG